MNYRVQINDSIKRPSKIRSKVTTKNFKRFKPRVLKKQEIPPVESNNNEAHKRTSQKAPQKAVIKPKPAPVKQIPSKPAPSVQPPKPEPTPIAIKKPLRPKRQLNRPGKPKTISLERTLLRQQLSNLRKKAAEAAAINKVSTKKRAMVRAQSKLRHSKGSSIKQIEGLKNIGLNRILVMIAAGPSVLEIDLSPIGKHKMIDFMCINKPYAPLWPTRFWAFCDHTQQRANVDTWNGYDGIIINSPNVRARKPNQIIIRTRPGKGFSVDVSKGYHIGRSSTYAAMQAVYYMAYKKVFLFGVDMSEVDGKLHFYGQNPDVPNNARKSRFPAEAQHYLWAGQNLPESVRERFVFCSSYNPWPFLKYFTKWDHKEAVQKILDYVDEI